MVAAAPPARAEADKGGDRVERKRGTNRIGRGSGGGCGAERAEGVVIGEARRDETTSKATTSLLRLRLSGARGDAQAQPHRQSGTTRDETRRDTQAGRRGAGGVGVEGTGEAVDPRLAWVCYFEAKKKGWPFGL